MYNSLQCIFISNKIMNSKIMQLIIYVEIKIFQILQHYTILHILKIVIKICYKIYFMPNAILKMHKYCVYLKN